VVCILMVPLVAMQFTYEVDWNLFDFIIAGILLFGTGLGIDMALRKMGKYRVIGALAVVGLFLWLWAELAVGVFTNWGS
jgi:hypothetical protein